ncbi:MAG: 6-phosphogluconolactonase [Thiolinea sp.]
MDLTIKEYADKQQQAILLADAVAEQLDSALNKTGKASLAVPGGTTPAPFLQALASRPLNWDNICITLSDERQVDADNERSNAKLLRDNFLDHAAAKFQPLFAGDAGQDSMQNISTALKSGWIPLDVCVLGMGTDGHFASLFPAADQLEQGLNPQNPEVVIPVTAANIPEPRVSLTLQAILTAAHIHLLITGKEKYQVLAQAQQNEQTMPAKIELPVQALLRHAGDRLVIHYTN